MTYEQFWAEHVASVNFARAMAQPLDVAVLTVQTRIEPRTPLADRIIRSRHLHRVYEDERVVLPILEPACLGRGA